MRFNLCTDLRERSKTSWSNKLDPAHDGHTASMRLKGKPWRVEMSSFGECVDDRKRRRHKLESWSRGAFVGVRVKTAERIVMDETRTYVESVRRVPEEQGYDHRLL